MDALKLIVFALTATALVNIMSAEDTYAYRVQYIESTYDGNQYIDTGIVPDANTTFAGKYEYRGIAKNGKKYDMVAGCTNPRYYPVSLNNVSKFTTNERHVYGANETSKIFQLNSLHVDVKSHTVVFNDAQHRVYVDGSLVGTFTQTFPDNARKCYLFAANGSGASYFSYMRLYWCTLTDAVSGRTLRRFIPVVDENGRPAMFDEIEKKLYYNLGNGADFVAGPRVTAEDSLWYFVEYLESDGKQYIDTGHIATLNTQTRVGYQYTDVKQVQYAMIGGSQSPRYYPVSINSASGKKERYCFSKTVINTDYPELQRHEIVFNDTSRNILVDGCWKGAIPEKESFETGNYPMLLFAANNSDGVASWLSKSRIWHCEIYEKLDLKRAFIPAVARDANGDYVPCMHERVSCGNYFNKGTGAFLPGRIVSPVVPLRLKSRGVTPSDGLNVLPFSIRPACTTLFTIDAEYANDFDVAVRSDGVYTVAKGTGGESANVVTITGDTDLQFPEGTVPACASVVLSGAIRLTADCDWRGLGKIVIPEFVTIDLNGKNLQVAGFIALPSSAMEITDSAAEGGALSLTVEENDIFANKSIRLTGSLKLVKKGAGTLVAYLPQQTYSGGTDIEDGVVRIGDHDINRAYNGELGLNTSRVFIGEGGLIDTLGVTNQEFLYVISNGTLSASIPNENAYRQISNVFTLDGNAEMTGKSFALMVGEYMPATIDMNGYTMTVNLDRANEFRLCNATFAGEGVIEGLSGWIKTISRPSVGSNLTIRFPTYHGGLWLDQNFTVSNLYSRSNSAQEGNNTSRLKILGTYTPSGEGRVVFPNILLADGATLDLSEMEEMPTFSTSYLVNSITRTVTFEDGTINVKLGSRKISRDVPIVAWTTPPENLDKLTFTAIDRSRNHFIVKRQNGLYLECGLIVVLR